MWEKRLLRTVTDPSQLPAAVDQLLTQQHASWDALREGEAALRVTPTRWLARGDAAAMVQANVRRSASTFAKTDATSIAERPCFLCEVNLPPAERGVLYDDLVLMPNPFPAVADHLTIATREHVPQRLARRVASLHRLARALGDERFVLYNGPRCGASAPDHFHFQCGRARDLPIFTHSLIDGHVGEQVLEAGNRTALHIRHAQADVATAAVERALGVLRMAAPDEDEAMVNVLSSWRHDHYVTLIFPRTRHRPDAFYARSRRLAISPAALEMAGLVVVSDRDQFDEVDSAMLESIFGEVCVGADDARQRWP
jgi:ATP adenylyltransferase/5',5'''-P-1,P-4-tetraphosphate phosphorylase II